ncbi:MAG: hypothetical protein EZS28_025369 [Streblomastix strix]|uniref:SPRY domain-containing protein n=1 Tax=Streblomastix strix TaxID=222440 RepID=A0A5J4V9C8_9EUKA|nr:MAG: hypothetical protein EZS28_025369 [Streblomastix strix]
MATSFSDSLRSSDSMTFQSGTIKKEIAFLVSGLQQEDKEQQKQITSRLLTIAQNECPQASYALLLYPLVTLLLNGNIDASSAAQSAIITLVNNSDDVRSALIKIGFIETARQVLIDENTPNHIESNMLDVIQSLLFQGVNGNEMIGLVSILSQLSEEKSEEKKKISQKAKMILNLLSGFGITGSSSSNNIQLVNVNKELKIQIDEQKRNYIELQRKDEEKQKQIIELQKKDEVSIKNDEEKSKKIIELEHKDEDNKRIIDENKILISELQRKDEDNKRKITDLERQHEDSKPKPVINNQIVSQPKSEEIPISISVPSEGYTKIEGEFTYTSTKDYEFQTFPIDQQFTHGICKCEFKINKLDSYQNFGVMKSGPSVPFNGHPNENPHYKNCMYFRQRGEVRQNQKVTDGNQTFKSGDIISLEVNMDIVPRTVRLFINGVLQPVYMSGIPDSIQFYFHFWNNEESVTVLSLKRLSSPTDATVIGAKEVKWEEE